MLKKLAFLVASILIVFSFLPITAFSSSYNNVSVTEAKQMIDSDPSLVILDVRTQTEYDSGHIRNAKLIPLNELSSRLNELNPQDRILVYCAHGSRSATASQTLVDNGFFHVYNMLGGIAEWIAQGYPVFIKYSSIQEAINNANEGDTLFISSGTYYEHVVVNKSVSLVGENRETTVIDADLSGTVLNVTVSNVLISDFTLQKTGCPPPQELRCGVYIASSCQYVNITNNNIAFCCGGIALNKTQNIIIAYNRISDSANWGIKLINSSEVLIFNNVMELNPNGIAFENSQNNKIIGNVISTSIQGLWMFKSNNNRIFENTFSAISFYAVYLDRSNASLLLHNNFMAGNKRHVASLNSINIWDNGVEGNYWSNYTGIDYDEDGIGDVPHDIDAQNRDNNPLMGVFYNFTVLGTNVIAICNSTITDFQYLPSEKIIRITVTNMTTDQTVGFCRICVPHNLVEPPIVVFVDGNPPLKSTILDSNPENTTLYITYMHSQHEILIVPELPSMLTVSFFAAFSLIAVKLVYKKGAKKKKHNGK